MTDLNYDLNNLKINRETIDEDFMTLHAITKHLDKHAPTKSLKS